MSDDLQQLFRDSVLRLPASGVDLDLVVRRGRRVRARHRVRSGVTLGVTGAVVVGVGTVVLSSAGHSVRPWDGAGSGTGTVTTPAAPAVPRVTPTPSPATAGATVPPPELTAVSLPDPAPGFGPRRFRDRVMLTTGIGGPATYWAATFGVGDMNGGHQATVEVGRFPMPATSGTPTLGETPGPITDRPTVAGFPAYVTHDGVQTILYFQTSRFTVEVWGEQATVNDLVTLAESLRGID